MPFYKLIIIAAAASLCNTIANTLWRMQFIKTPFNISSFSAIVQTFLSLSIIIGILFYVCSMLLFFYLLSNNNLSAIIPVTSLTYIFNILAAYLILHEKISVNQIVGIGIVLVGIIVLSRA